MIDGPFKEGREKLDKAYDLIQEVVQDREISGRYVGTLHEIANKVRSIRDEFLSFDYDETRKK